MKYKCDRLSEYTSKMTKLLETAIRLIYFKTFDANCNEDRKYIHGISYSSYC